MRRRSSARCADATAAGGYDIAPVDTGLEDVFIHLMQGATDNWGSKSHLQ